MKKVYTHPNPVFVMNIKNLLELEGFTADIRNEYSLGAVGELSCNDVWPELWVEADYESRVLMAIKKINRFESAGDWSCCTCREQNSEAFECCWQCGNDRSDD